MSYSTGIVPAAHPTPKPRPLRALVNIAFFLIACAAGCAVLGWLAPFPAVPGIFPKWEWFKRQRDQFDVLFFGSSRFFHQVIPQQFDEEVAQAGGAKVRSFNFAYDGAWPPESFYLLRKVLTLRPARLKWVVIELKDIDFLLDDRNRSTLRTAYWHDARHTWLACEDILTARISEPDRRALLAGHIRIFLQRATNMGRGAELIGKRLAPPPTRKKPFAWEPHAGYDAGPPHSLPGEMLPRFTDEVARMKKLGPPEPLRPIFYDAVRAIIADVRRAGAEPIFVITPTINPEENHGGVPDGPAVWSFNDPSKFPALYDPAHRYDLWHLNHEGAVRFTTLLAARFAELTHNSQ